MIYNNVIWLPNFDTNLNDWPFSIIPVILSKMDLQLSIQWLEINDSIYDKKNKNYRAFLLSYWMVRAVESADQCSVAEYNTARKIKGKK